LTLATSSQAAVLAFTFGKKAIMEMRVHPIFSTSCSSLNPVGRDLLKISLISSRAKRTS
jgi:hypothetical protein